VPIRPAKFPTRPRGRAADSPQPGEDRPPAPDGVRTSLQSGGHRSRRPCPVASPTNRRLIMVPIPLRRPARNQHVVKKPRGDCQACPVTGHTTNIIPVSYSGGLMMRRRCRGGGSTAVEATCAVLLIAVVSLIQLAMSGGSPPASSVSQSRLSRRQSHAGVARPRPVAGPTILELSGERRGRHPDAHTGVLDYAAVGLAGSAAAAGLRRRIAGRARSISVTVFAGVHSVGVMAE
jgi:hypothetical protein